MLAVLSLGVFFLKDKVNLSGKASGTPANLVIDMAASYSVTERPWANLAQGGEEKGRSLEPTISSIRKLNPKYIRIDHIYDYFDVVRPDGSYNWAILDSYIGDIRSMGAKPFLSLSYMPKAFGVNSEIDMPANLSNWTNLVRATIEHVSGRSGLSIPDVYYEVWNEPDLFGSFKVYPPKNYLDLYIASSNGATGARNVLPFKFGGPATTALYKNWFTALTDPKLKVRLDFFSWHRYSDSLDNYEQDMKDISSWGAPVGMEFFITESGIDSANNEAYDGVTAAIHTLGEAAVTSDKLEGLFSFEVKDGVGNTKNWGRWGILTHEKWGGVSEKPRFAAISFLNRLSGAERLNIAGQGSFVKAIARKDKNVYRVLIVNYDPNNKNVEAVPMKFVGLTSDKISVRRIDFLGGSADVPVIVTNKEWSTVQYFRANSASIFEITI